MQLLSWRVGARHNFKLQRSSIYFLIELHVWFFSFHTWNSRCVCLNQKKAAYLFSLIKQLWLQTLDRTGPEEFPELHEFISYFSFLCCHLSVTALTTLFQTECLHWMVFHCLFIRCEGTCCDIYNVLRMTFVFSDTIRLVCAFEDDSCPLEKSDESTELWLKIDGNGIIKDNTLNIGLLH